MRFHFWGVRGSTPTPLTPEALKAKISSIIQRVKVRDLDSPETREMFLANLPDELYDHIGGNTTCVEILGEKDVLIIDGGTGIRELGNRYVLNQAESLAGRTYHILITHFHWDHLQGLPFFAPFFYAQNTVKFYSPIPGFEVFLRDQMREPYFPVPLSIFPATIEFIELKPEGFRLGDMTIQWRFVNHPGTCVSYKFLHEGKSLVFSTDTELRTSDFVKTEENLAFYENIDCLILDAQYTLGEAFEKANWGHSPYSLGVDFALEYGIKNLYLFHHEPNYSDQKVEEIGRLAQWYADHKQVEAVFVKLAREGRTEEMP